MKKVILSLFVLLVLANPVFASHWVPVDGNDYLVDTESIQYNLERKLVQCWVKSVDSRGKSFDLLLINCKNRTYSIKKIVKYDNEGECLGSYSYSSGNKENIVPDSRVEALYEYAKIELLIREVKAHGM